jgi:tetratricopeptide (TPR) repeat protein
MWMLELVREYAAELLARLPGDAEAVARNAYLDHVVEIAERFDKRLGGPDAATWAFLDAEAANFAVALSRLQAAGDMERLAHLVVVLLEYWFYTGALADAEHWLAVADAPDVPARTRARLRATAASHAFVSGDLKRARASFEAALADALTLGDDVILARTSTLLAVVDRYSGSPEEALARLAVARGHAVRAQAQATLAVIDNEIGEILLDRGDTQRARPLIERLRDRSRTDESLGTVATSTAHLALLAHLDGDDAHARELMAQALAVAEGIGVTPALADVLLLAGMLELSIGAPEAAATVLSRAVRVNHESALLVSLPMLASLLGVAQVRTGNLLAGARLLAVGRAWRAQRGIAMLYRLAAELTDAAQAAVAVRLSPQSRRAAAEAGAAVPFGSADALVSLTRATVVDIRRAELQRERSA